MPKEQLDRLFEVPVEKFPTEKGKVDPIEEMVGALCDPIIVFPGGGWEQDLPERLKSELPLRRLIHVKLCFDGKTHLARAPPDIFFPEVSLFPS